MLARSEEGMIFGGLSPSWWDSESECSVPAGQSEHTCSIESIIIDVHKSATYTSASGCDAISPAICLGIATEDLKRSKMSVDVNHLGNGKLGIRLTQS